MPFFSSRVKRTPEPKHARESSSSGWTSSASGSTVVDNNSGFAGPEAPGSPAEVAARHGGAGFRASSASGGSESSGQQQRGYRGKLGKLRWNTGRSSSSETPSDTERKRKADGSAHRTSSSGGSSGGGGGIPGAAGFPLGSMNNFSRQPGRVVDDRFEVLDTLGTGYSGKVKRAFNHQTGEVVALKVMDKLPHGDPTSARRFERLQREVDAMRRCAAHDHTVALKEARFNQVYPKRNGEPVDAHILVLELCEKGELFDLLYRGGPVPDVVCKEYFRQLMSGVKFCHDQGVCHRDLKPENLLLDSDFTLKIADFGFAASGREGMMCDSIVGSKTYMAPEVLNRGTNMQYDHHGYDGAKADVWSAGVILFTMLAGHPPMEKANSKDWWFRALKLNRHDLFWQSHENTLNANNTSGTRLSFPDTAKHLVSHMLTVKPGHRISVDQIMAHPYMAAPSLGSSIFRPHPREILRQVMQERYNASMASKRLCTVASSSRGTADSAGAEGSGSPSAASAASSATAGGVAMPYDTVPRPYERLVERSPGDDGFEAPCMTEEEAARVTGGFMAVGGVRNMVKALEKALSGMGAEIDGLNKDGTKALRETFKVSAKIPAEDKEKNVGPVGIVAKVFRVAPPSVSSMEQGEDGADAAGAAAGEKLVVVLRRKRGNYYRYRKVEDALVSLLTGGGGTKRESATAMDQSSVNMSPMP